MRLVSARVSGNPCRMHHSSPGEISSFTCSTFASVIRSPGTTSAPTRAAETNSASTPAAMARVTGTPTERRPRCRRGASCGRGGAGGAPMRRRTWRAARVRTPHGAESKRSRRPRARSTSMPRVHQRRHREELVADPRLLSLIEVPPLLAREAWARERRLGRVLELQVHHHDGGLEAHLVRVLDHAGALEGLLLEAPVVDPYLPQLARAVVDVRVGNHPRLLVDEDDALPVGVLRQLGDPLHHPHLALLPHVVEGPVGLGVPLHGVVPRVHGADQVALAYE